MPQSVTLDDAGRVRVVLSGQVTRAEFEALFVDLRRLEAGLTPIPDRISDISGISVMETGYEQMLSVASKRSKEELPNGFRSAIVAVTPMQYGMARMFQSLNTHPKIELKIVGSMAEALAWLGETDRVQASV